MTNIATELDKLIEAERKKAHQRILKLRQQAAAEQRRIDEKVIELLRTKNQGVYEQLAAEAKAALDMEQAQRSTRAKKATPSSSTSSEDTAAESTEHETKEQSSWNS